MVSVPLRAKLHKLCATADSGSVPKSSETVFNAQVLSETDMAKKQGFGAGKEGVSLQEARSTPQIKWVSCLSNVYSSPSAFLFEL